MGYWKDRKAVKYAKLVLRTTGKLYRKNRKRIAANNAALLEKEMAAVEEALRVRDIPAVTKTAERLAGSFEKYLGFARKSTFREYAEAFIFAILLAIILRTFVIQLFKIPTGSMQPTLQGAADHRWLGQHYGDHILVNKFIYGPQTMDWIGIPMTNWGIEIPRWRFEMLSLRKPKRGDIAVFKYPFHYHCLSCGKDFNLKSGEPRECQSCHSRYIEYVNKDFIKRIIGLPDETVEIRKGDIYINDVLVSEPEIIKDIYYRNILPGNGPGRGPYGHSGQKIRVPDDCYFVLGDNSGSSKDSRFWGFVPFDHIRGKAFFIYLPPWRIGLPG